MAQEIIEILRDAFENIKEVIHRFMAAYKKLMNYFNKEETTAEEESSL